MTSNTPARKLDPPELTAAVAALADDATLLLHLATASEAEADVRGARANLDELRGRAVALATALGATAPPVPALVVIRTAADEVRALRELCAWAVQVAGGGAPAAGAAPAPLAVAPYGRWTPQALANYMAALRRPANTPTARGVTPPHELDVCDWLDAQRANRSAGAEGDAP